MYFEENEEKAFYRVMMLDLFCLKKPHGYKNAMEIVIDNKQLDYFLRMVHCK